MKTTSTISRAFTGLPALALGLMVLGLVPPAAHAATISQATLNISSNSLGSEILNDCTLIAANHFGGVSDGMSASLPLTLNNGLTFGISTAHMSSGWYPMHSTSTDGHGHVPNITNVNYSALMRSYFWVAYGGSVSYMDIPGLTIGRTYRLQLVSTDPESMTVSVEGTNATWSGTVPSLLTITWTAADTVCNVVMTRTAGEIDFNGYALHDVSLFAPVVDITNSNFTVNMDVTRATIGGTNNEGVVGTMRLASVTGTTTNYAAVVAAATSWTATVSNLVDGVTNVVAMTVTNRVGQSSNDTVQIYRKPFACVDITNVGSYVATTNATQYIAGTNNFRVVGGLKWTNSMGGGASLALGGWSFTATIYTGGANIIAVSGTNAAGDVASDAVTVTAPSGSNDILVCSFVGLGNADISGTNIVMPVPLGQQRTNLAPTCIISDYAAINPLSGSTNNFTSPVTYTVTAQNGSNKAYRVTVTNVAWRYSGSIYVLTTPDGANLPGSASATNFPVLVRFNSNNFDFSQTLTDGSDIRFYTPAGTALAYQVEEWDSAVGTASIWVRVPLITGNTNQELKMYWGNITATNQSNGRAVFNTDNTFASVIHLDQSLQDDVGTLSPANVGSTPTTAVIGKGRNCYPGTGVNGGDSITNYPYHTNSWTTSVWFRPHALGACAFNWGRYATRYNGSGDGNEVDINIGSPASISWGSDGGGSATATTVPVLGQWYHVAVTYENGNSKLCVNGNYEASGAGNMSIFTNIQMTIGGMRGTYQYDGDIDEVRVSRIARSTNWIRLEYENQKIQQTAVGSLVQPGTNFFVSPTSVTMNEGTTTNLTAQAGGALKVYWIQKKSGQDTVLAVDQLSLNYAAGRVVGNQSFVIQFKAVYPTGAIKTNDIPITVNEAIPDPVFTLLPSTNLWDGRSVMTLTTNIANWAAMLAAGATNLTYNWNVAGVAVTKVITPGLLTLTRSQGSGPMTVRLVMDNGGALITNSTIVTVQQPTNDAWVVRTPGATEQPTNEQFYARDDTGLGTVYYNGTIGGSPSAVFITIYTNAGAGDLVYTNISQAPVGGSNYAFTAKIKAGLVQYKLQFRSVVGATTNLLNTVTNLICGDAYIVDGQSNAVADNDAGYSNRWIRSFGSMGGSTAPGWGMAVAGSAQGDNYRIGVWEMYIASNLVANYKVPICIVNGAVGGTRIDVHQRGGAIYNAISNRVTMAGLTYGIRAFLWHQGENNSGADGPDGDWDYKFYQQYFVDMSAAWKQDCPNIRNYFIYQVYPRPCAMGPMGDQLREVQRELPYMYSNMRCMSTVGLLGYEGCHYASSGYYNMASVMLPLVQQDIYGLASGTNTAPDLKRAYYITTNQNQIALVFGQNMTWVSGSTNLIFLDGVGSKVSSGSVATNVITLQLTGSSTNSTITYLKDSVWDFVNANLIYGQNGISALTFADVPITPVPTGVPFVDITNVTGFIAVTNATQYIAGTNNMFVVGGLTWTNSLGGNGTLATGGWNFTATLYPGNNVITVNGTNVSGVVVSDSVTISRAVAPLVDITNANFSVAMGITVATIGGTNNAGPAGFMSLQSKTGAMVTFSATLAAATPWTATVSNLVAGTTNFVTMTATNAVGSSTNDTVQIYCRPIALVGITNIVGSINVTNATQYVAGTNTLTLVGGMTWTNSLGGGGTLSPAAGNWNFTANLAYGNNVIVVNGTNVAGDVASDSVTVVRAIVPYVDITNANFAVGMGVTETMIGGTNNAGPVGFMTLQSTTGAVVTYTASIPAATPWSLMVSNLVAGTTNFATMTVTNGVGSSASDTVQIYRRPQAFVDITNVTGTISTTNATQYIAGTNNTRIVGGLTWTNSLGGGGTLSPGGWNFTATLAYGNNVVTVNGTNVAGDVASDSVTVTRNSATVQLPVTNGLIVWVRADAIDTNDTVNEVRISGSSIFVVEWDDQSGYGNNASNITQSDQPLYITNALNGKPVLRFTQVNDNTGSKLYLGDLSAHFPSAGSLFAVGTINSDGRYNLFGNRTGNDERWVADTWSESHPGSFRNNRAGGTFTQGGWPTTGSHVFSLESDSTTYRGIIDGTQIGSDTPDYHNGNGANWTIGDDAAGNGQQLNGDIPELILYDHILSSNEANQVGRYLADKYAISTAYPANTPLANILTFGLSGYPATISGTNISWLLPTGTDVSNLAPTYTLSSGATCNKASGSTNNFSSPVTYTVVSSDNLITNVHTVTVTVVALPPVTSGLALWLDASLITGLSDGNTVNTWKDMSGLNNDATRVSGAPTYRTNVINGKAVVRFSTDGYGGDDLTFNRISTIQTVFWVLKENSGATANAFLLGDSVTYDFHRGGGNNGPLWDSGNANANVLNGTTRLMGTVTNGTTAALPADQFQVISLVAAGNVQANQITQDRTYRGSIKGDIAEILVYTTALSSNEEAQVGSYLAAKYALATAYPGQSPQANILTFGPGAVITGTNIAWTVPYGTPVTNLAPTYTLSTGATCNRASGSTNNFTSPVTYTVRSSDNKITNGYVATVTVTPASSAKAMLTFGPGAVITGTNIAWSMPYGTVVTNLAPTYTVSQYATGNPASGTTRDFTTPQTYTVTAQDLSSTGYLVTVSIAAQPPATTSIVLNVTATGTGAEILNDGTLVAANHFGNDSDGMQAVAPVTLDSGITFGTNTAHMTPGAWSTPPSWNQMHATASDSQNRVPSITNVNFATLMRAYLWVAYGSSVSDLDIPGLTVGHTYRLQLISPDPENCTVSVEGTNVTWSGTAPSLLTFTFAAVDTVANVVLTRTAGEINFTGYALHDMTPSGPSAVLAFQAGRGANYGQVQLAWSNGPITVLCCTNRTYPTNPDNPTNWFVLASGVSTPWTDTSASNYPSVYYRIVSGGYTSSYDVGKFDINVAAGSIAWLSFPFGVQPGCDVLSEWFGQQLDARPYAGYNFPSLQRQATPGGTIQNSDYYVNGGVTNWNPDSAIAANACYVLFLPQDHGAVKVTGIGMVQTNSVTMQVPYNSVPWVGLAYDVTIDMRQSGLTNLFSPPKLYSSFNYDYVDSQETPGSTLWYSEYYIDNWGTGTTNFFPSVAGADKLEAGKGYLLFFSTTRSGTGVWTCVKPY